ncbi:hypothetical protein AnigIFM60653_004619 [Aspergillus niger]|nr:hypothetical protein AnigIFM60653_004619 [Aspergillus niger]
MICIAGNISFNGLIYPKDREPNASEYFEVVEGGADLITRFLHEARAEHGCTVKGPHDDERLSQEEQPSRTPAVPEIQQSEQQSSTDTSGNSSGQNARHTRQESPRGTTQLDEGQNWHEVHIERHGISKTITSRTAPSNVTQCDFSR